MASTKKTKPTDLWMLRQKHPPVIQPRPAPKFKIVRDGANLIVTDAANGNIVSANPIEIRYKFSIDGNNNGLGMCSIQFKDPPAVDRNKMPPKFYPAKELTDDYDANLQILEDSIVGLLDQRGDFVLVSIDGVHAVPNDVGYDGSTIGHNKLVTVVYCTVATVQLRPSGSKKQDREACDELWKLHGIGIAKPHVVVGWCDNVPTNSTNFNQHFKRRYQSGPSSEAELLEEGGKFGRIQNLALVDGSGKCHVTESKRIRDLEEEVKKLQREIEEQQQKHSQAMVEAKEEARLVKEELVSVETKLALVEQDAEALSIQNSNLAEWMKTKNEAIKAFRRLAESEESRVGDLRILVEKYKDETEDLEYQVTEMAREQQNMQERYGGSGGRKRSIADLGDDDTLVPINFVMPHNRRLVAEYRRQLGFKQQSVEDRKKAKSVGSIMMDAVMIGHMTRSIDAYSEEEDTLIGTEEMDESKELIDEMMKNLGISSQT